MSDGTAGGWTGGCHATFRIDGSISPVYEQYIIYALTTVTENTGIRFTQTNETTADVTYWQKPVFTEPGMETAYAYELGSDIFLLDPAVHAATYGQSWAALLDGRAVLHETLHWLGLGHDLNPTEEEVMSERHPQLPADYLHLGVTDRAGLAYAAERNGCTPPPPAVTPQTATTVAPSQPPAARPRKGTSTRPRR